MVSEHYGRVDDLTATILAAFGPDAVVTIDDLAPADEFHLGGAMATAALVEALDLTATDHVLDIGSGLGGPARRMASLSGCLVTGVDVTPSFVAAATALTERVGLTDKVEFAVGDATRLAVGAGFTAATLIHVGMNIADKRSMFESIAAALVPGGRFGVYDIMRVGDGDFGLPQPFASDPGQSHVERPADYVAALEGAGFEVAEPVDRSELALAAAAAAAEAGPPPASLASVMGPDFAAMFGNLAAAVRGGVLAPVQIIATR